MGSIVILPIVSYPPSDDEGDAPRAARGAGICASGRLIQNQWNALMIDDDMDAQMARMRQRFEFLEKASEILAGSLDFKTTLANVAQLAVPHIGDWCAVDLCGGEFCDNPNELNRLTVAHVDPTKIELAYELEKKYPPDPNADVGLPNVIRTGRSEFLSWIPPEMLLAGARDDEHRRLILELGLVSYRVVPLLARGRILGAITLVSAESGRQYDAEDLSLAEDLARRAATAIDNANLFKRVQQVEHALRQQLDITTTMMASLGQGVYALDREGRVTYMNPACERMLGWTLAELAGKSMHDVVHGRRTDGTSLSAADSPLLGVMRNGIPHHDPDDVFFRKDGGMMPVEYTASPIVTDGRITGAILAFHDISDRKRQEEELRSQREWLQIALSSIGDAVIATDIHGEVTFINPIAEELTGWKAGDATGRDLRELFKVVDARSGDPVPDPVTRVLETSTVMGQESNILLISNDGREIPIDDSAAPIRDSSGTMIGVILVFHDITDRKRSEDALRRSNQRISRILESIGDAFIALDHDWRFTYVNAKAEQIFSRLRQGEEDLIGKVLWAEFPDLIWTDMYDPFHKAIREQKPVAFELFYPEAGGWFGIHAYPSFDSLSVFIQDITERKRIDQERTHLLENAQESERRFRDLVDMLIGVYWEADPGTLGFRFVGESAEEILGYPIGNWLASPDFWPGIIHEEDRETVLQSVRSAADGGGDQDFVYRAITSDGRMVWLRMFVYVMRDPQGAPTALRGVMADVTAQQRWLGDADVEPGEGEIPS